jgi:hypothetical protein
MAAAQLTHISWLAQTPAATIVKGHSTRENRVMKTTNNLINRIGPMKQSKWILSALMALALVIAFLGVTGCSPPHH